MSLNAALYTRVITDTTISGLIGTKFYPATAVQEATAPYAVYQRISTPRDYTQDGASGMSWPRYQITSIAATFSGARALADAMRARLSGFSGTVESVVIGAIFLDQEADEFRDALNEFTVRQDYIIWHVEA